MKKSKNEQYADLLRRIAHVLDSNHSDADTINRINSIVAEADFIKNKKRKVS